VLLKLTGSSCSGKTTLALAVAGKLEHAAVHDFDEVGVPERADHRWRQRMTEFWVRRALQYQDRGIDLLLTGQSPLGEVLAAPSAPRLDAIAICLVDVADEVRRERLDARGRGGTTGRGSRRSVTGRSGTGGMPGIPGTSPRSSPRAAGRPWPGTGGAGGTRAIPAG
jgi:hypothetical protein